MKYKTSYRQIKDIQTDYEKVSGTGTWLFQEPYIFDYFDKLDRNVKILDLGCYSGHLLNTLHGKGFKNLEGIDVVDFAAKTKNYNLNIVDINKEKFPFTDETFDYVTALQVLEHVENYFHPMHEAYRVLKPGGMFVFSVPNQFNIFNRFRFAFTGNMISWNVANNHMLFLTRDVFKKTYLNKFEIDHIHYDKGGLPFWGRLNKMPFVKVGNKKKVLPRCEFFGYNACYFLKKK